MLSFLISLFAVWIATRSASSSHTYGYHRYEVVGALLSVGIVWVLTGILVTEAIGRLINPEPVDGQIMFIVAALGLVVNLAMMKILHQGGGHHGHSHDGPGGGHSHGGGTNNINVQAAYIHVLGDLVQSIGVLLAAVIIWIKPDAHMADPLCTLLFAILVIYTTLGVARSAFSTLLNGVPENVNMVELVRELQDIEGVSNVHDLHVWSFGPTGDAETASFSVHIAADDPVKVLHEARKIAGKHGLTHTTIQVERCGTADVANCESRSCEIDVYAAGTAPPQSIWRDLLNATLGRSPNEPTTNAMLPQFRVRAPRAGYEHVALDGSRHAVKPHSAEEENAGHGHSHTGSAHGHSHAHGASCSQPTAVLNPLAPPSPRRAAPPALSAADDADGDALARAMGLPVRPKAAYEPT